MATVFIATLQMDPNRPADWTTYELWVTVSVDKTATVTLKNGW